MATLLQVDVSSRGDYSVSRKLSAAFAEEWKTKNQGGKVIVRDLTKSELPFVDLPWISGAYATPGQLTPEHRQALRISDELIGELMEADEVVIGTPMYNFGVPASLKAWIDNVVRINVTFSVDDKGYHGLVLGKKATFLVASGGDYTPGGPAAAYNQETPYLQAVFGFIGITDNKTILAGGTSAVMQGKVPLEEYLKPRTEEVRAAV